jgi:hypothetical protein
MALASRPKPASSRRARPLLLVIATLVGASPACQEELLVGEQRVAQDADSDASRDSDVDQDEEADVETRLTCVEAMVCVAACGEDVSCALDCHEQVCASAEAAFVDLRDCALPRCMSECADFGSSGCQSCVGEHCSLSAFACVQAECE